MRVRTLNHTGDGAMNGATPLDRLTEVYGENVLVSRINGCNIIHLDNPPEEEIKRRIKEVLDGQIDGDLERDCPLCQAMRGQPCDIVYYKQ